MIVFFLTTSAFGVHPMPSAPLYLGLTIWSHNQWQRSFYGSGTKPAERLERYARVFNTTEGNSTFYATPSARTVQSWHQATHDDFRFTFKLPSEITHKQQLRHCQAELHAFLSIMEPLFERLGQWTIQLPAGFSPQQLPDLQAFCQLMPRELPIGVEVRHPDFFAKGPEEKALNQWLGETGYNRIIMDSRPVFSAAPDSEAVIEAHRNKPRVPVHAIATSDQPMIRFIGHPELEDNDALFAPWLSKIPEWIAEGKRPYLMIHTPDNVQAPELAQRLYLQLANQTLLTPLASFPAAVNQAQLRLL
jgi:uncharacterized protein YecE (DUF72 family)